MIPNLDYFNLNKVCICFKYYPTMNYLVYGLVFCAMSCNAAAEALHEAILRADGSIPEKLGLWIYIVLGINVPKQKKMRFCASLFVMYFK